MTATCPHFDHHDATLRGEDLFALYERLREERVSWSPEHGGFWIVARYDDVRQVLRDHETFSSAHGCFLPDLGYRSVALEQDPPEHDAFRKLYQGAVGRTAVLEREPALAAMIERVVGKFAAAGGGDARARIAEQVPVEAVALMLGLSPAAAARVRRMTSEAWRRFHHDPDALAPLAAMLLEEVEARRAAPREDFLTRLTVAEVGGRRLTDAEIANTLVGAVVAGHETTMNASTSLMHELALDPQLQARLRERPELIPQAIDESLRRHAPIHLFFRTVTRATTLAGRTLAAGDKVAVLYASANRDPERFADPDAFSPEREDDGHVTFGWGIHRCVGAFMAQTELRLLVEALLRAGTLELDGEPEPAPLEGGHHMGLRSLPLRIVPLRSPSAR